VRFGSLPRVGPSFVGANPGLYWGTALPFLEDMRFSDDVWVLEDRFSEGRAVQGAVIFTRMKSREFVATVPGARKLR
jgi:hypothetical protein